MLDKKIFVVYISVKGTYLAYSCEQTVEVTSLRHRAFYSLICGSRKSKHLSLIHI